MNNKNRLTAGSWDNEKKEWTRKGDQAPSTELVCLKNLPSVLRACVSCDVLTECALGRKLTGISGDKISITEKVLRYDWMPHAVKEFDSWSLEELREFNSAMDERDRRLALKEMNKGLTAGSWDMKNKRYVTDQRTGEDSAVSHAGEGLSVGVWDAKKKRWVAKK